MESLNGVVNGRDISVAVNVKEVISEIRENDRISGVIRVRDNMGGVTVQIVKTADWSWIGTLDELLPLLCNSKGIKLY